MRFFFIIITSIIYFALTSTSYRFDRLNRYNNNITINIQIKNQILWKIHQFQSQGSTFTDLIRGENKLISQVPKAKWNMVIIICKLHYIIIFSAAGWKYKTNDFNNNFNKNPTSVIEKSTCTLCKRTLIDFSLDNFDGVYYYFILGVWAKEKIHLRDIIVIKSNNY